MQITFLDTQVSSLRTGARRKNVVPDGGARSATLELMITLSLPGVVRRQLSCADHSDFMSVVDTYELAV